MKILGALLVGLLMSAGQLVGQESADETEQDRDDFERSTPSGQYVDPASFFRFHGYVSLNFAAPGSELGLEPGSTPQILISQPSRRTGRNEGGFRHDAALFVGGEPLNRVGSVIEIHFVGTGLDPVITEAKLIFDVVESDESAATLRVVGGRFWWPFGIHNAEWFSALNPFGLISPAAGEVVPAHYNEVGLMGEGEIVIGDGLGANYAVAIGNGVPSFELPDAVGGTASDENGNRSTTGRVGLVWNGRARVEAGVSLAGGQLREGLDDQVSPDDARRFAATYRARGLDLSVGWKALSVTSYLYASDEDLTAAPVPMLERTGYTISPSVRLPVSTEWIRSVDLLGRVSSATEMDLDGTERRRRQVGFGTAIGLGDALSFRMVYVGQSEGLDAVPMDNDVFNFSLTAQF